MGDPICKWRAARPHNVVELVNDILPHEEMPENDFYDIVDNRMPGFMHTPYQLAAQLGLYAVVDGTYYPRFKIDIDNEEATRYLENVVTKYYVPNPYTKRGFTNLDKPILLEKSIVEYLEKYPTQNDLEQILKHLIREDVGNYTATKTLLSYSKLFTILGNTITLNPNYKEMEIDVDRNNKRAFFEIFSAQLKRHKINAPIQQILFGAPGTGKSHTLNSYANITEQNSIRTTFHPDSDYSTFVGCYKPTKDEESGEITYDFTPQAFTNAYVTAWKNAPTPFFLIIEEVNRGNCAQIFGDIFQLLDRDEYGYSSYKTTPDQDLANYIRKQFAYTDIDDEEVKSGKKMQLPPNLYIWATMNTSDQSLFPIDSAFKRRWDWRYIPIDYTDKGHYIACGDTQYSWADFLQKVNDKVESVTQSEDKKLGYWFMGNGAEQKEITVDRFVSKVVFYLWNDVFKDFGKSGNTIFKDTFAKFHKFFDFGGNPKEDVVKAFLDALGVKSGQVEAGIPEAETPSNAIDYTKYSFDGEKKLSKKALGEKIVLKYLKQNPNLSFEQIRNIFTFDNSVETPYQYKGIIAKTEDITDERAYSAEQTSSDGVKYKILTWWNKYNVNFIIKFAEAQGWSITEEQK